MRCKIRTVSEILQKTKYKENEIENFWAECYLDYNYFAEHVLGYYISNYHREWTELMEKFPRICLIAFRGSGKTCWVSGYFIWKAIFNENLNFLILSSTFEQSKEILKNIRKKILENELLKQFVPEGKETVWRATELTTKTGATFYCRTYGENVRGLRIDYCFPDEAGKYADKSIFWEAITPVVQLNRGKIFVLGTRESPIDLLSDLKENEEYMTREYPAEVDGKPLWEQKYTMLSYDTDTKKSLIRIRKEMGELPYMQEYLLIPVSTANSLFPYELTTKSLANDEKFYPFGRKNEKYYVGYDISAGSVKGDFAVMIVLGINADRKKLALGKRFKKNFNDQKIELRNIDANFEPLKIAVDATGLGEQQAKELQLELPNVIPKKFTYEEKYKMMLDLRREFEKFNIVIPNDQKDPETYSFVQELLTELNDFTLEVDLRPGQSTTPKFKSGRYDDCVASLALANWVSQNAQGQVSCRGIE